MQRANCFGGRRRLVCRSTGSRGGIYCYGDIADGRTKMEQKFEGSRLRDEISGPKP